MLRKCMMCFVALISSTALCTGTANAGIATGEVGEIRVANHVHTVAFSLNAPIKDTPRCNESNQFSFDLRKHGGDAMLRLILAAKRDGFTVRVQGLNTCSSEWKAENVRGVIIK